MSRLIALLMCALILFSQSLVSASPPFRTGVIEQVGNYINPVMVTGEGEDETKWIPTPYGWIFSDCEIAIYWTKENGLFFCGYPREALNYLAVINKPWLDGVPGHFIMFPNDGDRDEFE